MRITNSCDVKPGLVMYHVYGINRENTLINELDISKYTVLDMPKKHIGALTGCDLGPFVKVNAEFFSEGRIKSYNTEVSLHDMGILDGKRAYNLNRVFTTKADALMFMAELQNNTFSYPDDIEFATNSKRFDDDKWSSDFNFF
ncbi:hypothetical protein [Yersinia phage MHG19]|nr:hypothetical protein [Yersinia phage MHG19]